jgi:SpoIID/LytB domain protein
VTRAPARLLLPLLALALLAPGAPALASSGYDVRDSVAAVGDPRPEVRFLGRGWGHGIGMSQYGAYARARDGQSAHQILTAYFPGTSLPERDTNRRIRVGLRQQVREVDVTPDGAVTWRERGTSNTLRQPAGETWYVCALGGGTRVQDKPCGNTDADRRDLGTFPADAVLDVDHHGTVIRTSDAGGEFRWGTHQIIRDGDRLTTVQVIADVETYLKGIAEVPDGWGSSGGQAAVEAQAIAARGFAMRRLANPRGGSCFCDLVNTTSDQVYRGWNKERQAPNFVKAVSDTRRKVLVHDGGIAQTFYSSSNGGRSENNEDVWGGTPLAYLRSIDDPYSRDSSNPYRSWTATASNRAVATALNSDLRSVEQLTINGRTDGGTPRRIDYRGRDANGREISGTFSGSPTAGVTLRSRLSSGVDVVRADGSAGVNALPSSQFRGVGFEPFPDDDGSVHEYATVWAHEAGIAQGFRDGTFRPGTSVTRGQMASFIYRTFDIPASSSDSFRDVDPGQPHGDAINALADAGIAQGYEDGRFRSGASVTRAQMASFLVRAIGLDPVDPDGRFSDVTRGTHARNIYAIADAGITQGCRSDRYCPDNPVARGQMATFLHRAVEGDR